jgi:hypothetical protein
VTNLNPNLDITGPCMKGDTVLLSRTGAAARQTDMNMGDMPKGPARDELLQMPTGPRGDAAPMGRARYCSGARRVIHRMVCGRLPHHLRHPPHSVPMLAASSTTPCDGARRVIHHVVYWRSPVYQPHGAPVLSTSSTT